MNIEYGIIASGFQVYGVVTDVWHKGLGTFFLNIQKTSILTKLSKSTYI